MYLLYPLYHTPLLVRNLRKKEKTRKSFYKWSLHKVSSQRGRVEVFQCQRQTWKNTWKNPEKKKNMPTKRSTSHLTCHQSIHQNTNRYQPTQREWRAAQKCLRWPTSCGRIQYGASRRDPQPWQRARGILILKKKGSSEISKYCPISLLNVEGKIKESQIQVAKKVGTDIHVDLDPLLHLDLAKAFDSVPHNFLWADFGFFRVPVALVRLKAYFQDLWLCLMIADNTAAWQHMEVAIKASRTITPLAITMAMEVIIIASWWVVEELHIRIEAAAHQHIHGQPQHSTTIKAVSLESWCNSYVSRRRQHGVQRPWLRQSKGNGWDEKEWRKKDLLVRAVGDVLPSQRISASSIGGPHMLSLPHYCNIYITHTTGQKL